MHIQKFDESYITTAIHLPVRRIIVLLHWGVMDVRFLPARLFFSHKKHAAVLYYPIKFFKKGNKLLWLCHSPIRKDSRVLYSFSNEDSSNFYNGQITFPVFLTIAWYHKCLASVIQTLFWCKIFVSTTYVRLASFAPWARQRGENLDEKHCLCMC